MEENMSQLQQENSKKSNLIPEVKETSKMCKKCPAKGKTCNLQSFCN